MKPLTFIRGAAAGCAATLLLALMAAPAALAAASVAGTAKGTKGFESTPLHLTSSPVVHTTSSGVGGSVLRTLVALMLVIGVIYGITWILRHARASKNPALGVGLERVASLPLGTGKSVALLRVGDELHLVGISEHGISGLRVFSEDEAYELGLPFHTDDEGFGAGGGQVGRIVETVRRMTAR